LNVVKKYIRYEFETATTKVIEAVTRLYDAQLAHKSGFGITLAVRPPINYPELADDICDIILGTIGHSGMSLYPMSDEMTPLFDVNIIEYSCVLKCFGVEDFKFTVVFE
jgi:hypothetical protein